MKKIMIVLLLCLVSVSANTDETIDPRGWHFGLGFGYHNELYLKDTDVVDIPLLGLALDYDVTSQLSIGFEYKGIIFSGLNALQLKYYVSDAKNSIFFTGGAEYAYNAGDHPVDGEIGAKVGFGYAWHHIEVEWSLHQGLKRSSGWLLRYKF